MYETLHSINSSKPQKDTKTIYRMNTKINGVSEQKMT